MTIVIAKPVSKKDLTVRFTEPLLLLVISEQRSY
jgi:hypothetical protein